MTRSQIVAALLLLALAGGACGKYGKPRRLERPAAAASGTEAASEDDEEEEARP